MKGGGFTVNDKVKESLFDALICLSKLRTNAEYCALLSQADLLRLSFLAEEVIRTLETKCQVLYKDLPETYWNAAQEFIR